MNEVCFRAFHSQSFGSQSIHPRTGGTLVECLELPGFHGLIEMMSVGQVYKRLQCFPAAPPDGICLSYPFLMIKINEKYDRMI